MSKKKYTPQAGDVCEWTYDGQIIEVMIISPIKNEHDCYEGFGLDHIYGILLSNPWNCGIDQLKLIYRP